MSLDLGIAAISCLQGSAPGLSSPDTERTRSTAHGPRAPASPRNITSICTVPSSFFPSYLREGVAGEHPLLSAVSLSLKTETQFIMLIESLHWHLAEPYFSAQSYLNLKLRGTRLSAQSSDMRVRCLWPVTPVCTMALGGVALLPPWLCHRFRGCAVNPVPLEPRTGCWLLGVTSGSPFLLVLIRWAGCGVWVPHRAQSAPLQVSRVRFDKLWFLSQGQEQRCCSKNCLFCRRTGQTVVWSITRKVFQTGESNLC